MDSVVIQEDTHSYKRKIFEEQQSLLSNKENRKGIKTFKDKKQTQMPKSYSL